jgi:SnoaL-like protein
LPPHVVTQTEGRAPIHLAPPIELYVKIENSGDAEALSQCFASNATVRDEGGTYQGLAAIKQWKAETKKKYGHTVAPLAIADRDGKTVLKAKLTGNFPGSPVTLEFSFVLEGGKIASLEIH